jgi:hypothetical protein
VQRTDLCPTLQARSAIDERRTLRWSPGKSHAWRAADTATRTSSHRMPRRGPELVPSHPPPARWRARVDDDLQRSSEVYRSHAPLPTLRKQAVGQFIFSQAAGLHLTTVVHMLCVTPRTYCRFHDRRLDLFCVHNRVTQHIQRPLPSEGQVLCADSVSAHISLRPAAASTLGYIVCCLSQVALGCAGHCRVSPSPSIVACCSIMKDCKCQAGREARFSERLETHCDRSGLDTGSLKRPSPSSVGYRGPHAVKPYHENSSGGPKVVLFSMTGKVCSMCTYLPRTKS